MGVKEFNELLAQARYSPSALNKIYDKFYNKLYYYVVGKYGEWDDAAEVVGKIFLEIYSGGPHEYVKNPCAWLFKKADDYVAANAKCSVIEEKPEANSELNGIHISACGERSVLSQMDEVSQKIVFMHFWEGYSYPEIASALNVTELHARVVANNYFKQSRTGLNKNAN